MKLLCDYGTDPKYECVTKWGSKPPSESQSEEANVASVEAEGARVATANGTISTQASSNESSDDEDEDEDSDNRPTAGDPAAESGQVPVVYEL